MKTIDQLDPITSLFADKKKVIVLMGPNPNIDTAASALATALLLRKKGAQVQIAAPADMRVEFSRLVGVDEVKKKIANRNLLISFPYAEEKVEKVSYTISEDGSRFNLVIAPKANTTPLDPATVDFDYVGAEADLVVMVGVTSFAELGEIYENDRLTIDSAMSLSLTLFPVPPFANQHLDAREMSSLCELTANLFAQLGAEFEIDSASNLLYGIESVTNSFMSPLATADTFETVALLLRSGARRQPIGQQGVLQSTQMPFISNSAPLGSSQLQQMPTSQGSSNPFAAAMSQNAQKSNIVPVSASVAGELKG